MTTPCQPVGSSCRDRARDTLASEVWAALYDAHGITFELRHTGNTLTGEGGASLGELMNRMGHSSTRAVRVYLRARKERDRQLARGWLVGART
jgi:hypothetical protein